MKLDLNPRYTPMTWLAAIIASADPFSAVLPPLMYAAFRKRFPGLPIGENPPLLADAHSARSDSLALGDTVFHITPVASARVIRQCADDLKTGLRPELLLPDGEVEQAKRRARRAHIHNYMTISSIEDWVGSSMTLMSGDENRDTYDIFADIIGLYNQRLAEVNADPAFIIQLN